MGLFTPEDVYRPIRNKLKHKTAKQLNKPHGWIHGAKWSEVPVKARACKVMIGVSPPNWWCAKLAGQERRAIEVKLDAQTVYLDNEGGWTLDVFLKGLAPLPKFRFMPVFQVMDDPEAEVFYKAKVM